MTVFWHSRLRLLAHSKKKCATRFPRHPDARSRSAVEVAAERGADRPDSFRFTVVSLATVRGTLATVGYIGRCGWVDPDVSDASGKASYSE